MDAPFRWENDQIAAELPGARLVFSTRRGGVSTGPYDSLNLGLLTEDAPENVRENRRRLGEAVGHPWERFCYGRQVHGATVRRATEPPSDARPYTHEDGQATTLTDAAAIVFVADCLPVLLADQSLDLPTWIFCVLGADKRLAYIGHTLLNNGREQGFFARKIVI